MDKFSSILLIVFLLTVISLLTAVILTFFGGRQDPILLETVTTSWKMGFGAILGLLGGRNVVNK